MLTLGSFSELQVIKYEKGPSSQQRKKIKFSHLRINEYCKKHDSIHEVILLQSKKKKIRGMETMCPHTLDVSPNT